MPLEVYEPLDLQLQTPTSRAVHELLELGYELPGVLLALRFGPKLLESLWASKFRVISLSATSSVITLQTLITSND